MIIYYKRITTWQKWPCNDLVDEDYISYSKSKKNWKEFFRTGPLPNVADRIKLVASSLRIKVSKVQLTKPYTRPKLHQSRRT